MRRAPPVRRRACREAGSSACCGRGSPCRARSRRRRQCSRARPRVPLPLEQLDLVRTRQHVSRAEARDPAADDRYPHNRHSPGCEYWLPVIDAPVPASRTPAPGRADLGTVRSRTSRISQVVTLIAVVVPPLGVAAAAGLLWNVAFHPFDLAIMAGMYVVCAFGITVGFHRYFTHRSFETVARRQGDARDPRLYDDAGPAHAVGDRSPQAPRALRPAGRPALAPRRPRRGRARDREGLRARPRRLDVHESRDGAGTQSTGATSTRTASSGRSTASTCCGSAPRSGSRSPIGYAIAGWEGGIEGLIWGGLVRDLRLPARDVQRELDLPHVRPPPLPLARRVAQQLARGAARVRRGLAQQPPRLPGLRPPRPPPLPARPLVVAHPRPREARA